MRLRHILVVAATVIAPSSAARAQNYPWCSNFHDGAGTNCGFSSYEQCMATARGSGGYCAPNTVYVAPNYLAPKAAPPRRRHAR